MIKALQCATLLDDDDCPKPEVQQRTQTPQFFRQTEFQEKHKEYLNELCCKCPVFKQIDQSVDSCAKSPWHNGGCPEAAIQDAFGVASELSKRVESLAELKRKNIDLICRECEVFEQMDHFTPPC